MYYECLWIGTAFEKQEHAKCADRLIYNPRKHRCDNVYEFETQFANGIQTGEELIEFMRFRNCIGTRNIIDENYSFLNAPNSAGDDESTAPPADYFPLVHNNNQENYILIENNPETSTSTTTTTTTITTTTTSTSTTTTTTLRSKPTTVNVKTRPTQGESSRKHHHIFKKPKLPLKKPDLIEKNLLRAMKPGQKVSKQPTLTSNVEIEQEETNARNTTSLGQRNNGTYIIFGKDLVLLNNQTLDAENVTLNVSIG